MMGIDQLDRDLLHTSDGLWYFTAAFRKNDGLLTRSAFSNHQHVYKTRRSDTSIVQVVFSFGSCVFSL